VSNTAVSAAGPRTEKFSVPMGRYLGYVVVAAAFAMLVLGVISEGTGSLALSAVCVAGGLIAWIVLIRPEVSAHANGLLMRNMLRDTFLPWSSIRSCRVSQTLQVGTRDRVYHGLGISKSARSANKERRRMRRMPGNPASGMGPLKFLSTTLDTPARTPGGPAVNVFRQEQTIKNDYTFAERRIETLAQKNAQATAGLEPAVRWDPMSVGGLTLAVVAIVLAVAF
jgi:hypothetical protein